MARRANVKSEDGSRIAKIRYDQEWEEYQVELWIEGRHVADGDYFACDFEDARCTAEAMVG